LGKRKTDGLRGPAGGRTTCRVCGDPLTPNIMEQGRGKCSSCINAIQREKRGYIKKEPKTQEELRAASRARNLKWYWSPGVREKESQRKKDQRLVGYERILRKKYGLSLEQYQEMLKEQDGKCYCCGDPPTGHKTLLAVDHCHKTGTVRRLLCDRCNRAIGLFKDDPSILRRAAEYLEGYLQQAS
jgi:Recombination endonuclease VII